MRAVVVSDLHLDWTTLGVSRFDDVAKAYRQSVDFAIRETNLSTSKNPERKTKRVDYFLNLGDVTDPDNGGATMLAVELVMSENYRLAKNGIRSITIPGNHDVFEDGSGLSALYPLQAMSRVAVMIDYDTDDVMMEYVDRPRLILARDHGDTAFACFPFAPLSHSYDPAKEATRMFAQARLAGAKKIVTLSHLSVPGIAPGEETNEMPRGRDVLFPIEETETAVLRLQGHYHRRQVVDVGSGEPIVVVGSAARLTFGEQNNKPAFLVVEV